MWLLSESGAGKTTTATAMGEYIKGSFVIDGDEVEFADIVKTRYLDKIQ